MKPVLTVMVAALAVPALSVAQEAATEIVVTPNRVVQERDSLHVATTVITRDEIIASMARDLNELLLGQAGITLSRSGGRGSQTSLFLRGTESDHTLVLIDGVQVTTATGAAARLEFIALDQIERIEIVRGPRSGIYGSEAIGGVLQIFTRDSSGDDLHGSVSAGAGTEKTGEVSFNLGAGGRLTNWDFSASQVQTDGFDARAGGSDDRDGFDNDSMSLRLSQQLAEQTELELAYSRFDASADYDDGRIDSESQQLGIRLDYSLSSSWSASVGYEHFKEENADAGTFGAILSGSQTRALRWRNDFDLGDSGLVSLGVDKQEQQLDYRSFGAVQSDESRDNTGVYGVYLFGAGAFDFELSLRTDDNERFGRYETGSLAAGWQLNQGNRIYASVGTAFKAPNLIDMFVDFPSFFFFANPDLEPEKSRNVEIGLQSRNRLGLISVNLFRNHIRGLITSDATFTTLANVDRAEIQGLELTLERDLAGWNVITSLTLLDHENRSNSERLLRRPDESFSLQARRNFADLELGFNWLVQSDHADIDPLTFGPSEVPGYGRLDLTLAYRLSDNLALRLKAGNVFDRQYEVVDGYNTYGRHGLLSVSYDF